MGLFLTYYLQTSLGYSPVKTGLAFLSMIGAVRVASDVSTSILIPRVGPTPIALAGMSLSPVDLVSLTARDTTSSCASGLLRPLLAFGLGLGLAIAPTMSAATSGIAASNAAVGSASVNTMQQVGGSTGTALLSSLAASAAAGLRSAGFVVVERSSAA
ncbi:hypothetical protein [Streptomyces sp. NPDC003832]